jgi:NodT family efflux transporter outer membrane factor (OMF) lipoprotein
LRFLLIVKCPGFPALPVGGAVLLVLFPVIMGCNPHVVDKDIHPVVEGNNSYSISVEGLKPQSRWWMALNDESLDALVVEALSDNLTLMQARARIEQAIAADIQARSFLYPEVFGRAAGESEWRHDRKPDDTFNIGLGLSWEIDVWGRLSSAEKSTEYEVEASREELEASALLLTSQVAETYFQIIEQNLQLALLDRQMKVGETLLELTELRFSYGEASVVDVFQQRQQLASTRSQIPIARSRLQTLENRLHVLLGKAPESVPLKLADDFPQLPELPSMGIPLDLLQNRPDLKRIYNQLVAIDYRVAEAMADRLPRIQLNGSGGVKERLATDGMFFSLLLGAVAPLLDWERRSAEVEKRQAEFTEELARYSEAYLTAIEEVENSLWQEQYQVELLKTLEHQINIARANLTETRNRYQQGLTDYLPVLAAIQSLQQLERDILSRRRQLISIRITLYRALGGSPLMAGTYGPAASVQTGHAHISEGVVK